MKDPGGARRARIRGLCELAVARHGYTHKELARRLTRAPGRIIPPSGNAKTDLIVGFARELGWPPEVVFRAIWEGDDGAVAPPEEGDFEELVEGSSQAYFAGQYTLALALAERARAVARTPDHRVLACVRGAAAYDGLGQFEAALEAEKTGLEETSVSDELGRQLHVVLANTHYTLGNLPEARSLAVELITWYGSRPPETRKDRSSEALAYYVHGNALRRLIQRAPDPARHHARMAQRDLQESRSRYLCMADDFGHEGYRGVANTCTGALLEIEVALGERPPRIALGLIEDGLDAVGEEATRVTGDWLESYAWWCIFGCHIALRHLEDERVVQGYMARLLLKADDIARRSSNWALRERVFALEQESNDRIERETGRRFPVILDIDELGWLAELIARFPRIRTLGLRLFGAYVANAIGDGWR